MYVSFLTVRIAKMGMCALELSYDTEEPRERVQAIVGSRLNRGASRWISTRF